MIRKYLTLSLLFLLVNLLFSQEKNSEEKIYSLSSIKLKSEIILKPVLDSIYHTINEKNSYSFSNTNLINYNINPSELNKDFFSNIEIIENTYIDYTDYIRGCGPLDDGITKKINSKDLILSNFLDNLVNNYIFKGKGVFFKK